MKYARTCSVTGEGMNEGWVWFDGDFYTSTKEITIAVLREDTTWLSGLNDTNLSELLSMTDDELLQFAFDNDICFWTEWEEID